jgi:hypothetical protein
MSHKTTAAGSDLRARIDAVEARLTTIAEQVNRVTRHTAELDQLRQDVASLKHELEDMVEATR